MSTWSHVAGCIRMDSLFVSIPSFLEALPFIFGRKVRFGDEDWQTTLPCTLPCGSEGSLNYEFLPHFNNQCINFGQVFIWGDLRDYSDLTAIEEWVKQFTTKLKDAGINIRDGVVTMSSGDKWLTMTYVYRHGEKLWVETREESS